MNLARLSAKRLKCHLLRLFNMRCRNLPKRSVQAPHTPLAAISCWRTVPRSNRRCHLHQGKSRRNRGPRHSGHWQGDLIGGTRNSHISSLGGTSLAFTTLVKLSKADSFRWCQWEIGRASCRERVEVCVV